MWKLDDSILKNYKFIDKVAKRISKNSIKYYIQQIYVKAGHKSKVLVLQKLFSNSFVRDLTIKQNCYSMYNGLHRYDLNDYMFAMMMYDTCFKGPHFGEVYVKNSDIKNVHIKTYSEFTCEYTTNNTDCRLEGTIKTIKSKEGKLYYGFHFLKDAIQEEIFTSKNKKSTTRYIRKYKEIELFRWRWGTSIYSNVYINGKNVKEPNVESI